VSVDVRNDVAGTIENQIVSAASHDDEHRSSLFHRDSVAPRLNRFSVASIPPFSRDTEKKLAVGDADHERLNWGVGALTVS